MTDTATLPPRVRLAHAPTPLEAMPNLSAHLDGPNLFVKRDDCTGLAMGGNKARQLEYYIGEAVDQGADTVLITGAVQSNFVRQAAAAARKCGMDCHIQLEDRVPHNDSTYMGSGNVLLDHLLGATIHTFPEGEDADSLGLDGTEAFDIPASADLVPLSTIEVRAVKADGTEVVFDATVRLDTPVEVEYYRNGGILQTVLRNLAKA